MNVDPLIETLPKLWTSISNEPALFAVYPISGMETIDQARALEDRLLRFREKFTHPSVQRCFSKLPPAGAISGWVASRQGLLQIFGRSENMDPKNLQVTLSHSDGVAVVLGTDASRGAQIGIDLEPAYRKVSQKAALRILSDWEKRNWSEAPDLLPLHFWVIKEAAYKAYPANIETLVTQYEVKSYESVSESVRRGMVEVKGHGSGYAESSRSVPRIEYALAIHADWLLAIAVHFQI